MEKSTEENHSSKMAVLQVLAGLINDPLLFSDGKHKFSLDDFPEQFHKILFGAVEHLATNGMAKISYIDIDQFLRPYPVSIRFLSITKGPSMSTAHCRYTTRESSNTTTILSKSIAF